MDKKKYYYGKFPLENSIIVYFVAKDKTVNGRRIVLNEKKLIEEIGLKLKNVDDFNKRGLKDLIEMMKVEYLRGVNNGKTENQTLEDLNKFLNN